MLSRPRFRMLGMPSLLSTLCLASHAHSRIAPSPTATAPATPIPIAGSKPSTAPPVLPAGAAVPVPVPEPLEALFPPALAEPVVIVLPALVAEPVMVAALPLSLSAPAVITTGRRDGRSVPVRVAVGLAVTSEGKEKPEAAAAEPTEAETPQTALVVPLRTQLSASTLFGGRGRQFGRLWEYLEIRANEMCW